ncbi:hypothetical protein IWW57_006150, partial [Coemansia sp. S610]
SLGSLPFFVRALYPFRSEEASGLTFDRGDIIEVLACLESGWWNGVCGINRGWFPSNYVEQVSAEQVQILRQAAHLQHQQLPSIPVASEASTATTAAAAAATTTSVSVSVAQPADQLATSSDIGTRRGSLADAQAGVASAVPSRLRTGRRPSSPHNVLSPTSEGDGAAMASVRSRSGSVDLNGSIVSPRGLSSSSVHTAEAVHVAQWESRVTLDGRTYFCNIFTDKTVWVLAADGGDSSGAGSRGAELIGDEATLVYVSLLMGRNDSGARRDVAGSDLHALAGSGLSAAGAWDQMAAGIALAAFALASSVSARAKHEYLGLLAQVVAGVKRLLLSSSPGAAEADGPIFRSHRLLRDSHTGILQHVCALTLSAKVASTVWPPPDAADAVHAGVAGLVRAVRAFIVD